MMTLKERFGRWRMTHGYGIHSPLAFRIVSNVIRPRRNVVYYGEEKLETDAAIRCSRKEMNRARLLLRFVADRQPSFVWISPGLKPLYREAIRLAGCVVRIYDGEIFPAEIGNSDMVVTDGVRIKKQDFLKFLKSGRSVLAFDMKPAALKTMEDAFRGGVSLDGAGSLIMVATSDSERHTYKISPF